MSVMFVLDSYPCVQDKTNLHRTLRMERDVQTCNATSLNQRETRHCVVFRCRALWRGNLSFVLGSTMIYIH